MTDKMASVLSFSYYYLTIDLILFFRNIYFVVKIVSVDFEKRAVSTRKFWRPEHHTAIFFFMLARTNTEYKKGDSFRNRLEILIC